VIAALFAPLSTVRATLVAALVALAAMPAAATEVTKVTSPGGITAWLVSDDTVPPTAWRALPGS
jgi:hypothetical protein